MTEQLSFEFESNRLEIGDTVQVTAVPLPNQDVEDFYYLQDFTGKKGELIRIIKGKKVAFEVRFPNDKHGIFNENEITKLGGMTNEKTIRKAKGTNQRIKGKK